MATTTRNVIVGTAGHIDHGKTSLIQKLTGVDTDRLPEEKKRGITIVLGFAPLMLSNDERVGVVDVPGHERFVKNMVAGAGGIDVALMVVAADEGVMPQTREHLEICQLLGIERGVVALTKIDRAEEELAELALEDVRGEVAGTFLEQAPIIPCSSVTGEGIDAVRDALTKAVGEVNVAKRAERSVLLPIDRCFSMKGFGSIVTGTLVSGTLSVGDTVEVLPPVTGHEIGKGARVRSIQVFKDSVEKALGGQRTAVNLQGVDLESLKIGQVVVTPGTAEPTRKVSVQLRYLASRSRKLKTGAKILMHTGTALVEAGLTLLDKDLLEPGDEGYATVRLKEPIATLPGQRFIARGFEAVAQAGRTIAGGVILDPHPGRRRRKIEKTSEVLDRLRAVINEGPQEGRIAQALVGLVEERGKLGLSIGMAAKRTGLTEAEAKKTGTRASVKQSIALVEDRLISHEALEALSKEIEQTINAYHKEFPFRVGISIAELTTRLEGEVPQKIVDFTAKSLVAQKRLVQEDGLRHPRHRPATETGEAKQKVLRKLRDSRFEPPSVAEMEKHAGVSGASFRELIAALVRSGDVVNAGSSIFLAKEVFEEAKGMVLGYLEREGEISTAQAKTLFGISRKYLIPLLEALDKTNVTIRVGEVRKAR